NLHLHAEDAALVKLKRGSAAGAIHGDLDIKRAWRLPVRHFVTEPKKRFLLAIMLGILTNLLGNLGIGGMNDKVGRLVLGAQRLASRGAKGGQHDEQGRITSHAPKPPRWFIRLYFEKGVWTCESRGPDPFFRVGPEQRDVCRNSTGKP